MSLDLTTLRLLKYRSKFEKLARAVPLRALDTKTQIIFNDFGQYFREFPDVGRVEAGPFMLWFKGFRHPTLNDEAKSIYDSLMREVMTDVDPALEAGLMKRLVSAAAAHDTLAVIEKFNAGEDIDFRGAVEAVMSEYDSQIDRKIKDPQIRDSIEDLLKDEENDTGFHWRLPCLNRHIKPLVDGDFVVVAARPDKGKTTFMSDQLTFMASQIDVLYPGEKRSILWLNNEGPGKRIVKRCVQSALDYTVEQMIEFSNQPDPDGKLPSLLRRQYYNSIGGRGGTLRVFDIHGWYNTEVEELIRQHNPAGVVFDMIDNIRFAGEAANNGQRTDQLLEAQYQWARVLGVKHGCWTMATSQISADGDGMQWPTLPMLKDSKTGKQGAADVIITLGAVNDPMLENSRYIGTTKNKKVRTGVPGSPMTEVMFDRDRGRYKEIAA